MKTALLTTLFYLGFSQYMAFACTLRTAQDNFAILNDVFQTFTRQIAEYRKHGEKAPASLVEKHRELVDATAAIRKLFAAETEKNAHMKPGDQVAPAICERYSALINKQANSIPVKTALAKNRVKPLVCERKTIKKRFGTAIRKKRQLTNAGKISRKEQIGYLHIATRIRKNLKSDFDEACAALHEYEKKLQQESR